ncbi:hypothetical protein [Nocardioides sp. MH1]|uniref:hypothetical protein n=1 Tax=Nocardioides sp. MH1 TaxID=3242490 RepID=UPI0035220404
MSPRRTAVPSALLLLLLAGCSTPDDEPTADGPSSSATSDAADEADYPDEGVDLVGTPELEGVYARALRTYVDFERGRRLTAREGRVSRLLSFNATARVVDPYREALRAYDGRGTYAGDVTVEFVRAEPHGDRLLIDVCIDATQLQVPDGAPTQLGEATRAPEHVEVTNIVGSWRVTGVDPVDGSC